MQNKSETTKYPFWQLHLITALLLSFTAGGLMLASAPTTYSGYSGSEPITTAGWPNEAVAWGTVPVPYKGPFDENFFLPNLKYVGEYAIRVDNLYSDIFLWIVILCTVAFTSEFIIRRHKAENQ